jgi:hypothetical protein
MKLWKLDVEVTSALHGLIVSCAFDYEHVTFHFKSERGISVFAEGGNVYHVLPCLLIQVFEVYSGDVHGFTI